MTKLKDLNTRRAREAQAKRDQALEQSGQGYVTNACGCVVQEKERYWIVQIPLMPVNRGGKPATLLLNLFQCDKCKAIVDGRTEVLQKEEKLIQVAT